MDAVFYFAGIVWTRSGGLPDSPEFEHCLMRPDPWSFGSPRNWSLMPNRA